MSEHDYIRRINLALKYGFLPDPDNLAVTVYHAKKCGVYDVPDGLCDCAPLIGFNAEDGTARWITEDGTIAGNPDEEEELVDEPFRRPTRRKVDFDSGARIMRRRKANAAYYRNR